MPEVCAVLFVRPQWDGRFSWWDLTGRHQRKNEKTLLPIQDKGRRLGRNLMSASFSSSNAALTQFSQTSSRRPLAVSMSITSPSNSEQRARLDRRPESKLTAWIARNFTAFEAAAEPWRVGPQSQVGRSDWAVFRCQVGGELEEREASHRVLQKCLGGRKQMIWIACLAYMFIE